ISPARLAAIPTPREQADYLRWRTYLLDTREQFKARTALPLTRHEKAIPHAEPVAAAAEPAMVADEIAALHARSLLGRSGDLEVYIARATEISNVLYELGRLRE